MSIYYFLFNIKEWVKSRQKSKHYWLLLSSSGQSHGLFYPFIFYRKELKEKIGLVTREYISDSLTKKKKMIESFQGDVIFVSFSLRSEGKIRSKTEIINFFSSIKKKTHQKIIFFDISDSVNTPYYGALPFVDLMLMQTTLQKREDYLLDFLGGSHLAHYFSHAFNIEPNNENQYFQNLSSSVSSIEETDKIANSWNYIFWKRIINTFASQNFVCIKNEDRPIDLNSRFHAYSGWCRIQRMKSAEILNSLSPTYKIIATDSKIPLNQFYLELVHSKICFSPFGWGEVCPKDFEAVMKGCLLMKPSVEHLKSTPEFFSPYETYVPVAWDLSDLKEKTIYYLENSEERNKIISNASKKLREIYTEKVFLNQIERILGLIYKK